MLTLLVRYTAPVEVGRYALALAICGPVFVFSNLKLRQVLATDAAEQFRFGHYLGQRIATSVVAAGAVTVGLFVADLDGRTLATALAVTACKALESIIDVLHGAMQRHEQMQLIARSQVWRGLGGLLVFGFLVIWTRRVEIAVLGLAVFTLPQIATNLCRVKRIGVAVRPSFDRTGQGRLIRLAWPLGVSVAAGSLAVNVPLYVMQSMLGAASVGIFAALAYFLVLSGTVVGALAQAASPRLADLYHAGQPVRFKRTLARLVGLGSTLGGVGIVGAVLLGAPVLRVVFDDEYAARVDVLVVLMVGAAVQYSVAFLGTAVNALRKFAVQMPVSIGALAVVTVSSILAVPAWGMMGGAFAVVAGQVFTMLCYSGLLVKVILPALEDRGTASGAAARHAAGPPGASGPHRGRGA